MKTKAAKETKKETEKIEPVSVPLNVFTSKDEKLKACVVKKVDSVGYEVEFYKDGVKIATESYDFHTRGYHERAAQNYVEGIKKIKA